MNRKELLTKLELVGRALANDNLVPIFQCFCFDTKKVGSFNDSIAITVPCKTKEAFAVNGKVLLGLLQNTNAENVEFSIGDDLVITADDSTFKLPWFPKTDFLFVEPDVRQGDYFLITPDFLEGVASCLMTSSNDTSQSAFLGVYLNQTGKSPTLYSTDGDAISRYALDSLGTASKANKMLSNTFCEALTKTFKDTCAKEGTLALVDEWVVAGLDTEYTVYGRLLEIDNPLDHEAEIKKTVKGKITYTPVPDGLSAALSRARVLSDTETVPTLVSIKGPHAGLLTQNQMGRVEDEIEFGDHAEVTANVSAEMIQRCIGLCDEMAIMENCCVFRKGKKLFILTSNMGD